MYFTLYPTVLQLSAGHYTQKRPEREFISRHRVFW